MADAESKPTANESIKVAAATRGLKWLSDRPPEFIVLLLCMIIGIGILVWFGVTQVPQHIRLAMSEIQLINDRNNQANAARDIQHADTIKSLRVAFMEAIKECRAQCKDEHDRLERLLLNGRKGGLDNGPDDGRKHPVATK